MAHPKLHPVKLILGSRSPRRSQLLEQIQLKFIVDPSRFKEPPYTGGDPRSYAAELARLKSLEVARRHPSALVIGADTIVVIDGQVLGKPASEQQAKEMLNLLSGQTHQVITAYHLHLQELNISIASQVETAVHFRVLEASEIDMYVKSGAASDKAGAYGIQDFSGVFVDRIEGCFYNVVGFPISDFYQTLQKCLREHQLTIE